MLGLFTKEVIISSLISSVVVGGGVFVIKEKEIKEREVLIIEQAKKNERDDLDCYDLNAADERRKKSLERHDRSLEKLREKGKGRQFFVPKGTPGAY